MKADWEQIKKINYKKKIMQPYLLYLIMYFTYLFYSDFFFN